MNRLIEQQSSGMLAAGFGSPLQLPSLPKGCALAQGARAKEGRPMLASGTLPDHNPQLCAGTRNWPLCRARFEAASTIPKGDPEHLGELSGRLT